MDKEKQNNTLTILQHTTTAVFTYYAYRFFDSSFEWVWIFDLLAGYVTGLVATTVLFMCFGFLMDFLVKFKVLDKATMDKFFGVNRDLPPGYIVQNEEYQIFRSEEVVGTFMDSPIHAWIHLGDPEKRFVFDTVTQKDVEGKYILPSIAAENYVILDPGVIYVPTAKIIELA